MMLLGIPKPVNPQILENELRIIPYLIKKGP